MSLSNVIVLGFGEAGSLTAESLENAPKAGINACYIALRGAFADLGQPHSALWNDLKDQLTNEDDAYVIWAPNAVILWDRLRRAIEINHRPDFLWPLSLALQNGALALSETTLFKAVGGFEISLFGFDQLQSFHHGVRARALVKLLSVCDLDRLTIGLYLERSWEDFESVKAPDAWVVAAADELALSALEQNVHTHSEIFCARHQRWVMEREALNALSRNTLAASEFARNNMDMFHDRLADMSRNMPYYGFWPFQAGKSKLVQPVTGYHPAAASAIWHGAYRSDSLSWWNTLLARGLPYTHVIDCTDEGHMFGLLYAVQDGTHKLACHAPDLQRAAWAQNAVQTNPLLQGRVQTITLDAPKADSKALAVLPLSALPDALWGKMDAFIPLDGMNDVPVIDKPLPQDFMALGFGAPGTALEEMGSLTDLQCYAAILLIHKNRVQALMKGTA